jgi:DNA gyrase subunit A
VLTVAADGTAKRSPLADYPVKGRGGKGLVTGTDALRWCGVAGDLHVGGETSVVVRPIDLTEARRAGRGDPIAREDQGPVTSVVVEQHPADAAGSSPGDSAR